MASMKQLLSIIALVFALSAGALAHNGNDHVRGTVTQVSAQSVTVQLADKTSKTLTISAKTEFETAGKPGHLADIKIGDRVVIDIIHPGMLSLLTVIILVFSSTFSTLPLNACSFLPAGGFCACNGTDRKSAHVSAAIRVTNRRGDMSIRSSSQF